MKLPTPTSPLSIANQLVEFDTWVTPSLAEVRDSTKFASELQKVVSIFDALASTTNNFHDPADCAPDKLTSGLVALVTGKTAADAYTLLDEAASLLFLVTGKTDNNTKCQFPIHLKNVAKWSAYPGKPSIRGGELFLASTVKIPRVIKSDAYLKLVGLFSANPTEQYRLLLEYVKFLLSDERYVAQLWALGSSYVKMKEVGHGQELLSSLVVFKVRGSASATAGHEPEIIMRSLLAALGMIPGVDYNLSDAIVQDALDVTAVEDLEVYGTVAVDAEDSKAAAKAKTRAYDFVLPFAVPGWSQKLFIQSQFYAGDAGSVSHKVVDQTTASREKVRTQNDSPRFIEYLDGAGYFSALNGDLRKLLEKTDTHSFVQVRSAPIRLRRALQEIGFLVPLEIEHAIARTPNGEIDAVIDILLGEGYPLEEVTRAIEAALAHDVIDKANSALSIKQERREFARRMFFLDVIAQNGVHFPNGCAPGHHIIPGYGDFYGLSAVSTLTHALEATTLFRSDFEQSQILLADVQWLEQKHYIMAC